MENPSSIASAAAVQEFLVRYLADREKGEDVPLEDYLELFPGHEPAIARKYEEIRAGPATSGSEHTDGPAHDPEVSPEPFDELERTGFTSEVVRRLAGRGNTFGRYDLKEELARGGQGTILRVWDEDLRRNLAMKVLHEKKDEAGGTTPYTDPRTLGRFLEEAQVTGQLDHPGVVPVHELGVDDEGRVYFTMKLVRGRDLKTVFDLVRKGEEGWTQTRALGVMLRVCEAMAYAHSKGVIHRDLKPSNVMVGKFGEVHVMDWGLARILDKADEKDVRIRPEPATADVRSERRDAATDLDSPLLTMDGDVVGTPAYMSPEQAQGDLAAMGPRSDVYAVGAMLYHLLAGRMPYVPTGSRLNNYAVWYQVQKGPPGSLHELAPDAPAELVAICEKAMARDARTRYADMMELAEDLRAYLEHRVVSAYETGTWAETRKWLQRNKPLAASLAAAVALLVAGLVTTVFLKERAEAETVKVLRLSDVKVLQDLLADVDGQWPLGPQRIPELESWLERAHALTSSRPLHQRTLAEMRQRALPRSAEETERDRITHPEFGKLAQLKGRLESLRRAQAIDRGDEAAGTPGPGDLEEDSLPRDAKPQIRKLVAPSRTVFGREELGLALAQAAVERENPPGAGPRRVLAWALFENGRFDEAIAEATEALRIVKADGRVDIATSLEKLEERIAGVRDGSLLIELEHEIEGLEAELTAQRSWRFESQGEQWHHDVLAELAEGLGELEATLLADGLVKGHGPSVPRRLAYARDQESGFDAGGRYDAAWSEVLPAIGEAYAGLELTPQPGLVPLGPDPESGLWEFGHLLTGDPAERRADGKLVLTEETGVVLVLLPGGRFWMGAQSEDPSGRNHDPFAKERERPVHEVELSPFFLSKYEMTQGQWKRLTGGNPSRMGPDWWWQASYLSPNAPASFLHPVESVNWTACSEWLPRAGLALPSEAQWEYAARAGTDTPWWTGEDPESLAEQRAANLADRHMKQHRYRWEGYHYHDYELWLDDGASFHAPVGTYAANRFGLHEITGNVQEWCADHYFERYYLWTPERDPVSLDFSGNRSVRDGSHISDAAGVRSAARDGVVPGNSHHSIGVRPARALDRP